jgi:hypothetical protein
MGKEPSRVEQAFYNDGRHSGGALFSSKQNVGIYAWGFILSEIFGSTLQNRSWQERIKDFLIASFSFLAVIFLCTLPVLWSGGFEKF